MKKVKVSLLALCALAGGALVASAAKGDKGFTYDLDVTFTNPVTIVDISGVPQVNTNFSLTAGEQGVALTDGAGKLDGVWDMYITGLSNAAPLVDGDYIVDLGGSITTVTKSGNPIPQAVVNMTMKGNGRSHDDLESTNGPASFSLTFNNKTIGGVATNSSVAGPFATNVFVVEDFGNGNFFTNIFPEPFAPRTNVFFRTGPLVLPFLTFTVNTSDTNASPIDNEVFEASSGQSTNFQNVTFYFGSGTPVNLWFLFGTNLFQVSALGTNIDFHSRQDLGQTNATVVTATTNVVFGINITNVPAFITGFNQANTATASASNQASVVSGVVTNTQNAGFSSATNNTVVDGIPVFSNSWLEVSGAINGSIKQGKKSTSVKNAAGLFTTPHSVFTPFSQTTFTTNGTGTNAVITTNVTQFVLEQEVGGGSLDLERTTHFGAKVVQFNKSLWSSTSEGFKGSGSISTKSGKPGTYTLNQKGVSRSKGSSLTFKGNTDSNYVAGASALTNTVTITNVASIGLVSHTFINTNGVPTPMFFTEFTTNNVVILPGTNIVQVISQNTFDVTIPGLAVTNTDTLGIRTVTATGKIKGQALPKTGISGINTGDLTP